MTRSEIVRREPVASLFAAAGLTTIVVLASLGEPVLGGSLAALVVGYGTGRSVSDAGRDAMYRSAGDPLAMAGMGSVVLVVGLALRWIGVWGAAGDVSRFDAFACAVSGLSIIGFVYGAWHEHIEFVKACGEPGARNG